jgi:hypothetical protein
MSELTRFICELHRYDQVDASAAVQQLKNRSFEHVTEEFVQVIYEQLKKESDKHMKRWHENATKSHYYDFTQNGKPQVIRVAIWSERYVLLIKDESTDADFHKLDLFDAFNDKTT